MALSLMDSARSIRSSIVRNLSDCRFAMSASALATTVSTAAGAAACSASSVSIYVSHRLAPLGLALGPSRIRRPLVHAFQVEAILLRQHENNYQLVRLLYRASESYREDREDVALVVLYPSQQGLYYRSTR